jgi:hypothetical protein
MRFRAELVRLHQIERSGPGAARLACRLHLTVVASADALYVGRYRLAHPNVCRVSFAQKRRFSVANCDIAPCKIPAAFDFIQIGRRRL